MKRQALPFTKFAESVGFRLTAGQHAFAAVAFDGRQPRELESEHREIAQSIFGSIDTVPAQARRVIAQVKGRDVGGTRGGALRCLHLACTLPLSQRDRDELVYVLFVAPKIRLARVAKRFALSAAKKVRGIRVELDYKDGFTVVRHDGRRIVFECIAAGRGGDTGRSVPIVAALLDEASFFRDEATGVVNDRDVFNALIPRLESGGQILIVSSPWTESGLLYSEYTKNHGAPSTALAAFCPTLVMRDDARTRANVEQEQLRDPENARREYGAEFLAGGAGVFFGPELLRPSVQYGLSPRTALPHGYLAGIGGDIGLVRDPSAFVAVHRDYNGGYFVADLLELRPERDKPLKLSKVVAAGCEFAARHGRKTIYVDHHALEPAREHLPAGFQLVPCDGGQAAKAERWIKMRELFRAGSVAIPGDHARLASMLSDVVARPMPGGGTSIDLPRRGGTHLDLVAALCLALWAARNAKDESAPVEHGCLFEYQSELGDWGLAPTRRYSSALDEQGSIPIRHGESYALAEFANAYASNPLTRR